MLTVESLMAVGWGKDWAVKIETALRRMPTVPFILGDGIRVANPGLCRKSLADDAMTKPNMRMDKSIAFMSFIEALLDVERGPGA